MIKPEDIVKAKKAILYPEVEQAVDFLIALKWNGRSATIAQSELINKIIELAGGNLWSVGEISDYRQSLFDKHMLDFEDIYREAGWSIEYDRPDYNETYETFWVFRKKN